MPQLSGATLGGPEAIEFPQTFAWLEVKQIIVQEISAYLWASGA
jgi:hypothetical protein